MEIKPEIDCWTCPLQDNCKRRHNKGDQYNCTDKAEGIKTYENYIKWRAKSLWRQEKKR